MRQPQTWATSVDFPSPLGRSATPSESKDGGHQGPALHGAILPLKLPEFAKTHATPLTVGNFSRASEAPLSSIHSSPSIQPFSSLPTTDRRTNRRNLSQHQIAGFISNFQLRQTTTTILTNPKSFRFVPPCPIISNQNRRKPHLLLIYTFGPILSSISVLPFNFFILAKNPKQHKKKT